MKKLLDLALAITCAFYTLTPAEAKEKPKKKPAAPTAIEYTVEVVENFSLVDINKHGELAATSVILVGHPQLGKEMETQIAGEQIRLNVPSGRWPAAVQEIRLEGV